MSIYRSRASSGVHLYMSISKKVHVDTQRMPLFGVGACRPDDIRKVRLPPVRDLVSVGHPMAKISLLNGDIRDGSW